MAKKDKEKKSSLLSLSEILHIKTHTVSTSNELSLSVLDARKQASEKQVPTDTTTKIGRVSLFTLNSNKPYVPTPKRPPHPGLTQGNTTRSIADTSSQTKSLPPLSASAAAKKRAAALPDPETEINRRKARRRLRRALGTTVVCCAVVAGLTVAGLFLSQEYHTHQALLADLDRSVAFLSDADEVVVTVDELVSNPLTEETIGSAEQILGSTDEAKNEIDSASKLAQKVSSQIKTVSDKEAARQAYLAAEARKKMLASGDAIIASSIDYYYASVEMAKMWRTVHQADALTQEAAALVLETTASNTRASEEKTNEALALFQKAREELNGVAVIMPSADLSAIADYLDIRIEGMSHALASDAAIYIQDKKTADYENDLYNQAEEKAAAIAAKFPKDPLGPLNDAFEAETGDLMSEYNAAREEATDTDAFLRDYLGTEK